MATPTSNGDSKLASLTGSALVDSVISGYQWTSGRVTYSFPTLNSDWSTSLQRGYGPSTGDQEPWSAGFRPLTTNDRGHVREALEAWSAVAKLEFKEVADNASSAGDVRYAYSRGGVEHEDDLAWTYLPSDTAYGGDVWFNVDGSSATEEWLPGRYTHLAVLHETGHAIGLKHPFEPESRSRATLPAELDSRSYTVMSYSAWGGDKTTKFSYEPTTPMVLDIAAVQHLYGVNTRTHAGNTRYVFDENANYHRTIWDAGGSDTIAYRSASGGTIDLREGIAGGSELGKPLYVLSAGGIELDRAPNVWIAYGAVIENATGGSGADTIIGNSAANLLKGGSGADSIDAGKGRDTLVGGRGNDKLKGGSGADVFVLDTTSGSDRISDFRSGTDHLRITLDIGDGDSRLDGALTRAAAGGFSTRAELVVVTKNLSELSASKAAAAVGSAKSGYAVGDTALFAVDTGRSSAVYLFTAADTDAKVEAGELHLLATLTGTASTALGDYLFA